MMNNIRSCRVKYKLESGAVGYRYNRNRNENNFNVNYS